MGTNSNRKPYPAEMRERAVRIVREQEGKYASRWAALTSIAEKFGCIDSCTTARAVRVDHATAHGGGHPILANDGDKKACPLFAFWAEHQRPPAGSFEWHDGPH